MTFLELQDTTLRELEEATSSPVFHTRDEVKDALNQAYQDLAEETEFYEKDLTIDLVANQLHYDLAELDPTVISIRRIHNDQNSRFMYVRTVPQMDGAYQNWTEVTGQPEIVVPRSVLVFAVWPMAAVSSGTLTAKVAATPPSLSADADTPAFPDPFHRALIERAKAELLPAEREVAKARRCMDRYRVLAAALREWVTGRASKAGSSLFGG